ncbi:MAG: insulinase family protein [Clostridiales bacterium]|nr:insulinase family protein [Clostridiales bacterium]
MVEKINNGGTEIYFIKTEKFKTDSLCICFCDNLDRDRAYKNALLPQLLRRGCETVPTARDISLKLQTLYGASISWDVEKKGEMQLIEFILDFVDGKYSVNIQDILNKMVDLIIEIIENPVKSEGIFKNDYFEQEKNNLNNLIKSRINNKKNYAYNRCIEEMCINEPFGVPDTGSLEDGADLDAEELYKYYTDYFLCRLPVKIFYCGRERPEYLINKIKMNTNFNAADKIKCNLGFLNYIPNEPKYITESMTVEQAKLCLGYRTNVNPQDKQVYALSIFNGILGIGVHSKLFQNVREKNSLAYYAGSTLERYKGLLVASSGIETRNKEKTLEIMLAQITEIQRGNISEYEFNTTMKAFYSSLKECGDNQFAMIEYYLGKSLTGRIEEPEEYWDMLKQVTPEDVVKVSKSVYLDTVYFLTGTGEV